MDFFEEQVSEERDPDLNDEEDTRMDDTREKGYTIDISLLETTLYIYIQSPPCLRRSN